MTSCPPKVLVLGAYGLIGAEVVQALNAAGFAPVAAGRNAKASASRLPTTPFVALDMARLTEAQDWDAYLENTQCVVNCAGALQDGAGTNLEALHHHAVAALAAAAAKRGVSVVQISAIGAELDSPIAFLSSKARGDAALLASGTKATVFRPGLVLAQGSYGGTALIRLLAAVPIIQPLALPKARMQCVSARDVAHAVVKAVKGEVPHGQCFDLVEPQAPTLQEIIAAHRDSLGFSAVRHTWVAPTWMITLTGKISDVLGHWGWRSPLRSTATQVLERNLTGDPHPWSQYAKPLASLHEILQGLHLGPEHRLQARMALLMPICVATLSLFWMISGLMGFVSLSQAAAHLETKGWATGLARASVLFWSCIDIGLGLALLWRPLAQKACLGMIAVCGLYLGLSTLFTPGMWLDPLGPLVKIAPAALLSLVTWALLEER